MAPKQNLTRRHAGQLAAYWCAGRHAQERGLAHGRHGPENPDRPAAASARPKAPSGAWDDLDEEEHSSHGEHVARWVPTGHARVRSAPRGTGGARRGLYRPASDDADADRRGHPSPRDRPTPRLRRHRRAPHPPPRHGARPRQHRHPDAGTRRLVGGATTTGLNESAALRGQLPAIDIGVSRGRPRYRVPSDSLARFIYDRTQ